MAIFVQKHGGSGAHLLYNNVVTKVLAQKVGYLAEAFLSLRGFKPTFPNSQEGETNH